MRRLALAALAAAALAGCASTSTPTSAAPAFDDQGEATVACMQHQTHSPTAGYVPGAGEDPELIFEMLHYYTANGNRPYCGAARPTKVDTQWLTLYARSGADPRNISRQISRQMIGGSS